MIHNGAFFSCVSRMGGFHLSYHPWHGKLKTKSNRFFFSSSQLLTFLLPCMRMCLYIIACSNFWARPGIVATSKIWKILVASWVKLITKDVSLFILHLRHQGSCIPIILLRICGDILRFASFFFSCYINSQLFPCRCQLW